LDVVCHTHNYESVVSYHFEGFSKHYNNENRFGIHNHTNTKYRGVTNFRYWVNSLNALRIYDLQTLLELSNFVRHDNHTYSKRKSDDLDDRVMSLIWAMFILENSIAEKYYQILDTDDQGKPLKIRPFSDNSDLLKKSPLLMGGVSKFKKTTNAQSQFSFVGKYDNDAVTQSNDQVDLQMWLLNWGNTKKNEPVKQSDENSKEEYRPIVIF
jgi:hypothetical protein